VAQAQWWSSNRIAEELVNNKGKEIMSLDKEILCILIGEISSWLERNF
jgi:hypothetical protein